MLVLLPGAPQIVQVSPLSPLYDGPSSVPWRLHSCHSRAHAFPRTWFSCVCRVLDRDLDLCFSYVLSSLSSLNEEVPILIKCHRHYYTLFRHLCRHSSCLSFVLSVSCGVVACASAGVLLCLFRLCVHVQVQMYMSLFGDSSC